jgi:hypothetical protein
MNELPLLSTLDLQILEILQSSPTFRHLIDEHPDLLTLLTQAAEAAATSSDRARLIEALARAAAASDKAAEVMCRGSAAELAEWSLIASRANEDLGQVLKQLCPWAAPIAGRAISAAPN